MAGILRMPAELDQNTETHNSSFTLAKALHSVSFGEHCICSSDVTMLAVDRGRNQALAPTIVSRPFGSRLLPAIAPLSSKRPCLQLCESF